jgi:hypothetical protein
VCVVCGGVGWGGVGCAWVGGGCASFSVIVGGWVRVRVGVGVGLLVCVSTHVSVG